METMTSFNAADTLNPRLLLYQPCQQRLTIEKRYYSNFMSDHVIYAVYIGEFPYELNHA